MPCFANLLRNYSQFAQDLCTNFNAFQISSNKAETPMTQP